MDLPPETDKYIRESIQDSLGLPVSAKTLRLKLLASQDERRRLREKIFLLEDRLSEADRRLEQCRAETVMNAQGLRRCIEEKAVMASGYTDLASHCTKLEQECALYEQDMERLMESCDDLARQNEELRVQLKEASDTQLVSEVESLRKDKEHLLTNLHRAEEEVKVLFEENNLLDEENKRLLKQLKAERHAQESGGKPSANASAKDRHSERVFFPESDLLHCGEFLSGGQDGPMKKKLLKKYSGIDPPVAVDTLVTVPHLLWSAVQLTPLMLEIHRE